MSIPRHVWVDFAAGVCLPIVLLITLLVDRLTTSAPRAVAAGNSLQVQVVQDNSRRAGPKRLALGVVPSKPDVNPTTGEKFLWDDMGKLLLDMGEGFNQFETVQPEDIARGEQGVLGRLDVLFLTCAPYGEELR